MTYCVAMTLNDGLLFASDSRTNAGVDQIATYCKMSLFEAPGDRVIALLNAGNLATTQAVINSLKAPDDSEPDIMDMSSMFAVAKHLGRILKETIRTSAEGGLRQESVDYSATFLVGGQIKGEPPRLFMVYPQGNFIEAMPETPYFQIGESKYGRPIIDRVITRETPIAEAVKCALVSFDSTIKSNLSVGLPIDLALIPSDSLRVSLRQRIEAEDPYFRQLRDYWGKGLRKVFNDLEAPTWLPTPA